MAEKDKVCRECGYLTTEKKCPNCNSSNFLDKFKGRAYIFNVKNSQVAQKLEVKNNGKFAIKYG